VDQLSIRADFVPRVTLSMMMVMTTIGLVLMAPYFAYVFRFLEPSNIIAASARGEPHRPDGRPTTHDDACVEARGTRSTRWRSSPTSRSNSISGKDKIIASRAVDALKDFAVEYLDYKPKASDAWFAIGEDIRENPDFVAMDPGEPRDLEKRRTWVEWKVMRQYLGIYNEALARCATSTTSSRSTRGTSARPPQGQRRRAHRARAPVHELVHARDAQREGRPHRVQRPQPVPPARRVAAPRRARPRARSPPSST
jgi:hypothetical protein